MLESTLTVLGLKWGKYIRVLSSLFTHEKVRFPDLDQNLAQVYWAFPEYSPLFLREILLSQSQNSLVGPKNKTLKDYNLSTMHRDPLMEVFWKTNLPPLLPESCYQLCIPEKLKQNAVITWWKTTLPDILVVCRAYFLGFSIRNNWTKLLAAVYVQLLYTRP